MNRTTRRFPNALMVFCAAAALMTSACGYGPGRQKEYSEEKQVADHADLAKPLDPTRAVGMSASVTGCLQKESGELILTRNDAGVVPMANASDPAQTHESARIGRTSYRLKPSEKQPLDQFVGKQVKVDGTLSTAADIGGSKESNLAQIKVDSASVVADACTEPPRTQATSAMASPEPQPMPLQTAGPIVAVGCVNHAAENGSLTGTSVLPPATPESAPRLANSGDMVDRFLLNGAQPTSSDDRPLGTAGRSPNAPPVSYVLDGTLSVLQPLAGHRVEVTGTLLKPQSPATAAVTQSTVPHIQVASVRTLAADCKSPEAR